MTCEGQKSMLRRHFPAAARRLHANAQGAYAALLCTAPWAAGVSDTQLLGDPAGDGTFSSARWWRRGQQTWHSRRGFCIKLENFICKDDIHIIGQFAFPTTP